ncbi:hypothetical protein M011DRAFT_470891 [Sporormia fimetaria CBS 119925]|uniref:Uncharacterized protein n=1 Tax=Sporormia fimetaria CBS 119925 TaxID=1340428 RepID=A0A6A6V2B8_9PLEO|nr:hypothetical protein M011DRAFT_470891 [Sporormia fimetaria CBS 119925]
MAPCIYKHTQIGSLHRKLAVDIFINVLKRDGGWFPDHVECDTQFHRDVYISLGPRLEKGIKLAGCSFLDITDTCQYHEHTRLKKPCYKKSLTFGLD